MELHGWMINTILTEYKCQVLCEPNEQPLKRTTTQHVSIEGIHDISTQSSNEWQLGKTMHTSTDKETRGLHENSVTIMTLGKV